MTEADHATSREWAHFDPAIFCCHFSRELVQEMSSTSLDASLVQVPPEILVHEAAHVLQAAATGSGLRLWAVSQNVINLSLMAVEAVTKDTGGVLPEAVMRVIDETFRSTSSDADPLTIALRSVITFRSLFFGGQSIELSSLEDHPELEPYPAPGFVMTRRPWPKGAGVRDSQLHAVLPSRLRNGIARRVSLGAIHLYEGQSAALEELWLALDMTSRGHSFQEIGDQIIWRHKGRPNDPYHIARELFISVARPESKNYGDPLEFILVIDLALMLDRSGFIGERFNS
ncbi:hypothetical protein, partial [Frankia sp. AgB1.9]|uniref:hypothetical protein n=1 Tax=Frankia sp. AgB1.9 TaxID=1836968 RepID=UPI001EE43C24